MSLILLLCVIFFACADIFSVADVKQSLVDREGELKEGLLRKKVEASRRSSRAAAAAADE